MMLNHSFFLLLPIMQRELILGKIRSNQLTNLTAMMLLGYDTKATIDFLYDEDITKVLKKIQAKSW
jgi:hypothetical protein